MGFHIATTITEISSDQWQTWASAQQAGSPDSQRMIKLLTKRNAQAESVGKQSLPDTPWPVAARGLMSDREKSLYQDLISLYPEHKIFVQVALSQLVDVARDHPERMAIRGRFKQLVADFVLCRPDLSIVAVIELDDRTHLRADRKWADARKSKALADAGLRLVRIPAGPIPPFGKLKALIEQGGAHAILGTAMETKLSLVETVPQFDPDRVRNLAGPFDDGISRKMKKGLLHIGVTVFCAVVGWFAYSTFLGHVIRSAFEPLASKPVLPLVAQAPTVRSPATPTSAVVLPVVQTEVTKSGELPAEQAAILDLMKQKNRAWAAFYSAPSSCEHPAAWNDQVECGNQYMRAKKLFEQQWAATHPGDRASEPFVLDNAAIRRSRPWLQSRQGSQ